MKDISAIVITLNEADNIERCLASLDFAGEIIVVDSFSSDNTASLARKYTPHVFEREWEGYSAQKDFALSKATKRWVLWIDADEEVSPELKAQICALDEDGDIKGYCLPRLTRYMGTWIRHCGWYPGYVLRLFARQGAAFNGKLVHEGVNVDGPVAKLTAPLLHYSYRNISHHVGKIDSFTTLAARQMFERGRRTNVLSVVARAFLKFAKMFFLRLGFLDGRAGVVVCVMGSFYEFLKYAKLLELQSAEKKKNT